MGPNAIEIIKEIDNRLSKLVREESMSEGRRLKIAQLRSLRQWISDEIEKDVKDMEKERSDKDIYYNYQPKSSRF